MDFCSIVSNILDNAIEACDKVNDEPYINCNIVMIRNQLLISVESSSSGKYNYQNGVYKTQKKEGIHGIGLKQTKSIVNKYDGICAINTKGTTFKIEISIPIECTKNVLKMQKTYFRTFFIYFAPKSTQDSIIMI